MLQHLSGEGGQLGALGALEEDVPIQRKLLELHIMPLAIMHILLFL